MNPEHQEQIVGAVKAVVDADRKTVEAVSDVVTAHLITQPERTKAAIAAKLVEGLPQQNTLADAVRDDQAAVKENSPFRKLLYFGAVNAFFGVVLVANGVQQRQAAWENVTRVQSEIQAAAAIEQTAVESRAAIAEVYAENQVAQFDQVILDGYVLNLRQPPDMSGFVPTNPAEPTIVFDSQNRCIGKFQGGQLFFVGQYPAICEAPSN